MKLIVGLGNPGRTYESTRHNAGAMCVQLLARRMGLTLERRSRLASLAEGGLGSQKVALAVPRAFMNTSGGAVSGLLQRYGAKPPDLVLVYDESDLSLGTIRVRPSGSAAGHKGVQSVIAALGTDAFPRVRIGIGRPAPGGPDQIGHVLSVFTPEEQPLIKNALERSADAVTCMIAEGIDAAMNRYNRRQNAEDSS